MGQVAFPLPAGLSPVCQLGRVLIFPDLPVPPVTCLTLQPQEVTCALVLRASA